MFPQAVWKREQRKWKGGNYKQRRRERKGRKQKGRWRRKFTSTERRNTCWSSDVKRPTYRHMLQLFQSPKNKEKTSRLSERKQENIFLWRSENWISVRLRAPKNLHPPWEQLSLCPRGTNHIRLLPAVGNTAPWPGLSLLARKARKWWGKHFKVLREYWLKSRILYPVNSVWEQNKDIFQTCKAQKVTIYEFFLKEFLGINSSKRRKRIQLAEGSRDIWLVNVQHLRKANVTMGTAEKGMQDVTKSKLLLSCSGEGYYS